MVNKLNIGRNLIFVMVLALGLGCIAFIACGGGETNHEVAESASEPVASSSQQTNQPEGNEKSATINLKSNKPADWKTVKYQGWSISFPKDWSGGDGVWWPGEGDLSRGRPALSVHSGGIPPMPNTEFESRVKDHIHGEPQERKDISVSGFSGFICTWEFQGKKHLGIFLEEKIGGMSLIHFVDCQAPSSDFDKHRADFEKIIASFKK